jgi:ribonuclease R
MQMAVYSPEHKGHFGLAYDTYTHFTSPIRRYPDLLIHRAIKHALQGKSLKKFPYAMSKLLTLGEHCSMTERRAEEATREVMSRLKCEYMQDKVGEIFTGLITGVTSFGFFVEIADIFTEGLVHITALTDDYYHFDPVGRRLYGEYSNKVYRLSDSVRVKVTRVDVEEKKVDFELA